MPPDVREVIPAVDKQPTASDSGRTGPEGNGEEPSVLRGAGEGLR